jgi:inosine-uridine nucleoside N-ribohydrolase
MHAAVAVIVIAAGLVAPAGRSGASISRDAPPRRDSDAPRVIIDTDLSRWWDDATALGIANILQQLGTVRVLGIMSDIRNPVAVAAIDAIDTAYGHGRIPIGAVDGSEANTAPHGYSDLLASRLPHSVDDGDDVPGAVALYRRLLARQPDHSVTVVSLGAYTNLAGLLSSQRGHGSSLDGRALLARKVKRLVIMDGLFPNGGPPFTNQALDLAAARAVVGGEGWPTPIAWVDGFDGIQTRVGGTLCTTASPSSRSARTPTSPAC